jgi:paraquat-inducible protein A
MTSIENIKDSSRPDLSEGGLIACHECDFLHSIEPLPAGGKALCTRCGALLYRNIPNSIERALALNLAGLMFFVMANVFPFISLKLSGRVEENVFLSGALALYRLGMGEVGLLVILTSFLFPFVTIAGMLYILLPLKFGERPWKMAPVYRLVRSLAPWNLLAVFMLGVMIAIVKLLDLATIIPGISLYSFVGLMVVSTAAHANTDPSVIWPRMKLEPSGNGKGATAAERDLIGCHTCALLVPKTSLDEHGHGDCPRCGTSLHSRKTNSLERTWALIFAATLLYIPANVYPVMTVIRFGQGHPNTILSGVVHLIEGGMWVLAMIIFFASIVVPVLKLIVLSFLLLTIKKKSSWRSRDRAHLFRVTEGVGAWSMVDIYVVAVLAGLVNLGALSTIRPGIGVAFFAAVVVITMFAAHSFDPRLIWDNTERAK